MRTWFVKQSDAGLRQPQAPMTFRYRLTKPSAPKLSQRWPSYRIMSAAPEYLWRGQKWRYSIFIPKLSSRSSSANML